MRQYLRHPPACIGRRGAILILLGIIWITVGLDVVIVDSDDSPYLLLSQWAQIRSTVWIITGCVAIAYAPRRQGSDVIGWVALSIMAGYRLIAYGVGLITWALGGEHGEPRGVIGMVTWAAAVIGIATLAGWRETSAPA